MPMYPTWAQLRRIRFETYGKGVRGWWKQGWVEYPEIMFSGLHGIFGIVGMAYLIRQNTLYGTDIKQFKCEYTVYRPDDSRTKAYSEFYEPNYTQGKK